MGTQKKIKKYKNFKSSRINGILQQTSNQCKSKQKEFAKSFFTNYFWVVATAIISLLQLKMVKKMVFKNNFQLKPVELTRTRGNLALTIWNHLAPNYGSYTKLRINGVNFYCEKKHLIRKLCFCIHKHFNKREVLLRLRVFSTTSGINNCRVDTAKQKFQGHIFLQISVSI